MGRKETEGTMHIRRTAGDRIFETSVIILFVLFTFICIFPFYYLLINTISDNDLVTSGRVNFFPMLKDAAGNGVFGAHFNNYTALRNVQDLGSRRCGSAPSGTASWWSRCISTQASSRGI